jgi:hypothetical protein
MAKSPYEPAKIPKQEPYGPPDKKTEVQLVNLHRRLNQSEEDVLELQAKLKELKDEALTMNLRFGQLTSYHMTTMLESQAKVTELQTKFKELEDQMKTGANLTLGEAYAVCEVKTKLKETIRAVEKLAKGKSLGCLGLPAEESWQKSTS